MIILADQALKIFIKTHFCNGDEVKIMGNWFRLHFIENEGMAYGMRISEKAFGKILLSSFRLVAVVAGFFILKKLIDKGYGKGAVICGSLILAGALGNLLDSMFYGLIFTNSTGSCFSQHYETFANMYATHNKDLVAHFTSFGTGYTNFLQGRVVDMLYFPVIETVAPKWIPFIGGRNFTFFEPVFNIADAAISVGVITLILFQKRMLYKKPTQTEATPVPEV